MILVKDGYKEIELTNESAIAAYKLNGYAVKVVKQETPDMPVKKPIKKK